MAKSNIYTQPSPTAVGLGIADLAPLTNAVNLSAANMNVGSNSPNTVAPATPIGTMPSGINLTAVASTGTTGIGTLMTYAVPPNSLDSVGRGIYVQAWGKKAGNAATVSATLQIGGLSYNAGSSTQSGVTWLVEGFYWKTASDAQTGFFKNSGVLTGGSLPVVGPSFLTDTAVDTSTININFQCTDGSGNATDFTAEGLWVQYMS